MTIKESVASITAQSSLFKDTLKALDIDENSNVSQQHERIRRVIFDINFYILENSKLEFKLQRAYAHIAEEIIEGDC